MIYFANDFRQLREMLVNIMKIFEQLANNAHHHITLDEILNEQSNEIKNAFLTNDVSLIRNQWVNEGSIIADKSVVVQVSTF